MTVTISIRQKIRHSRFAVRLGSAVCWLASVDAAFDAMGAISEERWLLAAFHALAVIGGASIGLNVWRAA